MTTIRSPKISVYLGLSLDGFIARPDGGLDWLEHDSGDDDYGYKAFMASVDVLVMGRRTFEQVLSFDVAWPYEIPVVVLSQTRGPEAVPGELTEDVRMSDKAPAALVEELAAAGCKHVYVDGGQTVRAFLDAGLVHEITISRLPVLIGEGLPLFGPLAADLRLVHRYTEAFASGVVQSRYEVPGRG